MNNQNDVKKLYKSQKDQILSGVIGGMGEYFKVDSTILRIGFIILVLLTGIFPGIIAYIIAFFIVPERPHEISTLVNPAPMKNENYSADTKTEETKTEVNNERNNSENK